jgi:hypothetical protein
MSRFTLFTLLICSVLFKGALAFCTLASPLKSMAALSREELMHKLDTTTIAPTCFINLHQSSPKSSLTVLHYDSNTDNGDMGGMKRGIPLLFSVLLICVWFFTIPPEFRRQRYCGSSNYCLENRAECNNCKTVGELQKDIQDYYRNGGGIKWDFSIDPVTKAEFDSKFK